MPKKTFYFSDSDIAHVYEKAKKYADELSPVVVAGLRRFVEEKEQEEKGMRQIPLFIGSTSRDIDVATGKYIKFIGKSIASANRELGDPCIVEYLELYATRKGKLLLYSEIEKYGDSESAYRVFDDVKQVFASNLPEELVVSVMKALPEVSCEELDI